MAGRKKTPGLPVQIMSPPVELEELDDARYDEPEGVFLLFSFLPSTLKRMTCDELV